MHTHGFMGSYKADVAGVQANLFEVPKLHNAEHGRAMHWGQCKVAMTFFCWMEEATENEKQRKRVTETESKMDSNIFLWQRWRPQALRASADASHSTLAVCSPRQS
jgi:hypothetical protein